MLTEPQTFLSPLFPPPFSKKKEEMKKKIENLSFATISWLPHRLLIPTDPRSLSHSGFSSSSLDSALDNRSFHRREVHVRREVSASVGFVPCMKKEGRKTRLLAGVDLFPGLWASRMFVMYLGDKCKEEVLNGVFTESYAPWASHPID